VIIYLVALTRSTSAYPTGQTPRAGYGEVLPATPGLVLVSASLEKLGDLDTLQQRLQEEVASSNTVVPWIALVGAWCRKPMNKVPFRR
jgi:hypothetical protein